MEEKQFISYVEEQTNRLYRVCRTILKSEDDCQDAVQSAILKAWLRLDTLRDEQAFDRWLIRIAINECRKLYRKSKPFALLHEDIPASPGNEHFWEMIYGLDEKYRIPITLFYLEQYKTREIAQILRIPEGTVKRRLHTARQLLKEVLS